MNVYALEQDLMKYCIKKVGPWWATRFFYTAEVGKLYDSLRALEYATVVRILFAGDHEEIFRKELSKKMEVANKERWLSPIVDCIKKCFEEKTLDCDMEVGKDKNGEMWYYIMLNGRYKLSEQLAAKIWFKSSNYLQKRYWEERKRIIAANRLRMKLELAASKKAAKK